MSGAMVSSRPRRNFIAASKHSVQCPGGGCDFEGGAGGRDSLKPRNKIQRPGLGARGNLISTLVLFTPDIKHFRQSRKLPTLHSLSLYKVGLKVTLGLDCPGKGSVSEYSPRPL